MTALSLYFQDMHKLGEVVECFTAIPSYLPFPYLAYRCLDGVLYSHLDNTNAYSASREQVKVENVQVKGFNRYTVDLAAGKVYDKKRDKIIDCQPNINGYVYLHLESDSGSRLKISEHRFIMIAAHESDLPEGIEVDHKDKCRSNNSIDNLELVTTEENMKRRNMPKTFNKLDAAQQIELNKAFENLNYYHGSKLYKLKNIAEDFGVTLRAIQYRYRKFLIAID